MWQLPKVEPPHGAITPWDAHPDVSETKPERCLRRNKQQEQINTILLHMHLLLGGDYWDPSEKKNWVP